MSLLQNTRQRMSRNAKWIGVAVAAVALTVAGNLPAAEAGGFSLQIGGSPYGYGGGYYSGYRGLGVGGVSYGYGTGYYGGGHYETGYRGIAPIAPIAVPYGAYRPSYYPPVVAPYHSHRQSYRSPFGCY